MRLESITIGGFRCFGPELLFVPLSGEVTAFIGSNAAGKTAVLKALSKLFGVSRGERNVQRSDFHVGAGADPEDRSTKALSIDVIISFPELTDGTATPESVAPSFRHMLIARPEQPPVCRMRLEARWDDDGTLEGAVTQDLYWIDTLEDLPPDQKKKAVSPADRGLIQLYYTPAIRDAGAQVKATTGALAARLLRAIEWSGEARDRVEKAGVALTGAFEGERAVVAISEALKARWSSLHDDAVDTKPRLSLVSRRFEEVIRKIAVIFEQGPDGQERSLADLSDGQQSLFYFALVAAVFDTERQVVAGKAEGFQSDQLRIPALSIFALEEPENHLSPFYLARILRQSRSMAAAGGAQILVTSHSTAVLSRVEPAEVRYCRSDPTTRSSTIVKIKLPEGQAEEAKFVRGALLAYPELYFARFVILVEGDSERVVLPRLAEALDLLVDPAFVAIVPLGGRHVQHFWRLLSQLGIPYATLLDLDLGRHGGGFGRIKIAIKKLIEFGALKAELLKLADGQVLADDRLEKMHEWTDDDKHSTLRGWIARLRTFGVYFSEPLDIDLAMLAAFPAAYNTVVAEGGGPETDQAEATLAVLGKKGPGAALYTGPYAGYPAHFPSYRYHLQTHSKPATHLAALTHVDELTLHLTMPPVLAELLRHVATKLRRN